MSEYYSRRVVRRIRYRHPSIPGTVNTQNSQNSFTESGTPPSPTLQPFDISARFLATISASSMVNENEDHPLYRAADALLEMSERPPRAQMGILPRRLVFQVNREPRIRIRPKLLYDIITIDSTHKINDIEQCPICLADYAKGDTLGVLSCKHNFHDVCLRTWTNVNRTCPLCRLKLN